MNSFFETLLERYPFPSSCAKPELFCDEYPFGEVIYSRVGISTVSAEFGEVVGGAAGRDADNTMLRAYFELIERVGVLSSHARAKKDPSWEVKCLQAEEKYETLNGKLVFPTESTGEWKYSLSNGVAAHPNVETACASARLELIERDRLLRSWYGEILPIGIPLFDNVEDRSLREHYELKSYYFGEGTVGLFGFPFDQKKPITMGFGASENMRDAYMRAAGEAIQRAVFLWDEEINDQIPSVISKVDDHIAMFVSAHRAPSLKRWLDGEHRFLGTAKPRIDPFIESKEHIFFADITPDFWAGKLTIVKAISPLRIPLTFGLGNPKIVFEDGSLYSKPLGSVDLSFDIRVHPIA